MSYKPKPIDTSAVLLTEDIKELAEMLAKECSRYLGRPTYERWMGFWEQT